MATQGSPKRTEAQWAALGDAQRQRYIRAGRTGTLNGRKGLTEAQVKRYYLAGKPLVAARRGSQSKENVARVAGVSGLTKAEIAQVVTNAQEGIFTPEANALRDRYLASRAFPTWVPRDESKMSKETQVLLAQIGSPPARWATVQFLIQDDGTVILTVQRKGRNQFGPPRPVTVRLPDVESAQEIGRWLQGSRLEGLKVEARGVSYDAPKAAQSIPTGDEQ